MGKCSMSDNVFGLVEMAFSFGLIFIFGLWQLWSIEKTRERLRQEQKQKSKTE